MEQSVIYERFSGLKLDTIEKAPSCSEGLAIGFSREEEMVTDDVIKKLNCSHEYGGLPSSYLHDRIFRFISLRDAHFPISIDPYYTRLLFSHEWP